MVRCHKFNQCAPRPVLAILLRTMSSDDFGTVNVKRGDRAREIEILRQNYRAHRDALVQMAREAPSEQLATEYQRLIRSIETSLARLNDLERTGPVSED